MDETDTLRRLLHTTADEAGDWPDPPSAVAMAAHRRRRRRAIAGAGLAVITVVAVTVPVALSTSHRATTAKGLVGPSVSTSPSAVSPGGRWTTLPKAPITARSPAATAWTGTQMLVWGGANGNTEYADGAAYNPATRRWTTMPKSPLSARSSTSSVWTGRYLFVYGDGAGSSGFEPSDGALYDPRTRSWATVPPAPMPGFTTVGAYWTGRQVLLLSIPGREMTYLVLQAFDPDTQKWTRLPDLHVPSTHFVQFAGAVMAGSNLYVWSEWAHTVQKSPNSTETSDGIDGFMFDLADRKWSSTSDNLTGDAVTDSLWTGSQILIPAGQPWCGSCTGPMELNRTGTRLDPPTGRQFFIPHGPADDLNPTYLWTGSVLLAANTGTSITGGGHSSYPGVSAYWTPATNRWTLLPHAPMAGADAAVVWTGHSLLIWGLLSPARHPSVKPISAGLELR